MPKKSSAAGADKHFSLYMNLQCCTFYLQRELAKITVEHGLTLSQFAVLEALYRRGDLSVCHLTDHTLATSGNMTVVLRNLEKLGLIERVRNPRDQRSFLISLSESGRALVARVFPLQLKRLRELLSVFDKDEKKELGVLLDSLRAGQKESGT